MSGVSNSNTNPTILSVNKPANGPTDIAASFEKAVALENKYRDQADKAGHVGFFGGVADMFVPSRAKNRQNHIDDLKQINQLIGQIMEKMTQAVTQQFQH